MENKPNIYKMFRVPGYDSWMVHNDYLEISKRFTSPEAARKWKKKANDDLDFENQQNRNTIGNNTEDVNRVPKIGGTDKTGSVDKLDTLCEGGENGRD